MKKTIQLHRYFFLLSLSFLLLLQFKLSAQEATKVMGIVRNAITGDTLPFVNIYFKDTQIGTTSGFDGKYSIESRKATDTLVASFIGYKTVHLPVQLKKFQIIDVNLESVDLQLSEVVIHAGENPAITLLRKVQEHKPENDPDKAESFHCKAYTKMQVDVNNISEKLKNRKLLEPFKFIFEQVDTSIVNGKVYLPVMLSESFSDVYYRRLPRARKEIINASQISGIDNATVSQFVGNMAQEINVYDNFINLFQKNFASPISNVGELYYKYYLIDSTFIGNNWCYNIMFKPRRKQEYAFTGNVWIHDSTFAVKQLEMRMAADANINFINDLLVKQEFDKTGNGRWAKSKEITIADFNVIDESKATMGFFGTRTVIFSDYQFDYAPDSKIYSMPNNILVMEGSNKKDETYWKTARPEALTHREASVYRMADTLNKIPLFNTYLDIIEMVTTGYYVNNKLEFGPYASIYSYNANEGSRFRLGGRTSNDFSRKLMLNGYVAYGTRDKAFKYQTGFVYMLAKVPDKVLKGSYTKDMEQLGAGNDAFREDFILNSLFRRNPQDKLSLVTEYKGSYKHEWFTGFSNTIELSNRQLFTIGGNSVNIFDPVTHDYIPKEKITTTEIKLYLHYGYREKVIAGEYERFIVSSPYPVLDIQYTYGIKDLFNSNYEYNKLQVKVSHWFNLASAGYVKYAFETGKTWGTLPFPLLKVYPGNETFYHDDHAFNLMNYYEFVSDEYITAFMAHHFEGFFLNRIPLIRKLKWREVATLSFAAGHTSADNKTYNLLPEGSYFIRFPYTEAGVGIENIFRFIRVDAVWRLFYNQHINTSPFGVLVSMNFDF